MPLSGHREQRHAPAATMRDRGVVDGGVWGPTDAAAS